MKLYYEVWTDVDELFVGRYELFSEALAAKRALRVSARITQVWR